MEFKVGDTVRLKSGGPLMTVREILSSKSLKCQWFDDKSKLQIDIFVPETVEAVDGTIRVR